VRAQLAGVRINDLKLFFNAKGELLELTRVGSHVSFLTITEWFELVGQ
jgi:hypothetical protein